MGVVFIRWKKKDKANKCFEESLKIRESLHGAKSKEVADIYNNLGISLMNDKDYKLAEQYFQKEIKLRIEIGKDFK